MREENNTSHVDSGRVVYGGWKHVVKVEYYDAVMEGVRSMESVSKTSQ